MHYTCPQCGGEFDDTTVYCEDWRDPKRNFGCPHCKTFLKKSMTSRRNLIQYLGIFASIFATALMFQHWLDAINTAGFIGGFGLATIVSSLYDHFSDGSPKSFLNAIEQNKAGNA